MKYGCSSCLFGTIDVGRSEFKGMPTVVGYLPSHCFLRSLALINFCLLLSFPLIRPFSIPQDEVF